MEPQPIASGPIISPRVGSRRVPVTLFLALTLLDTTVFVLDKMASQHASDVGGPFYLRVVTQP